MALIRRQETWDPFRELDELRQRMGRAFGLSPWSGNGEREPMTLAEWAPSCNISENDKEYRIRVELPEVKKDDVHVRLEQGVLTIQGERKEEKEEKGARVHRREISYGSFMRRFSLPADADESKIDASFKDGMLNVKIGKTAAKKPEGQEIAVQ